MDAAKLTVLVQANAKQLKSTLAEADKDLTKFVNEADHKLGAGSLKMSRGMAVGMAAVGAAITTTLGLLAKLGEKFEEVEFTLIRMTGASGAALEEMTTSFKRVYTQVTTSSEDLAKAMGALSQRTGLTGKALEDLLLVEAKLAKVTGTDLQDNIRQTTRLFGDWSIPLDQTTESLDWLFKVSQKTGISLTQLAETVVYFGAPMRQLGFTFETATATLGKWEKEGVNITTVLAGLRMGLKQFALSGQEADEVFLKVIAQIKAAKTQVEATTLAFKWFGVRAGTDMGAAIREGRYDIDELVTSLRESETTIMGVSAETQSLGAKFTKLKHQVEVAASPLGEKMLKVLENLMPAIEGVVAKLAGLAATVAEMPDWTVKAAVAVGLMTTAVGGLFLALPALQASLVTTSGLFATMGAAATAASAQVTAAMAGAGALALVGTAALVPIAGYQTYQTGQQRMAQVGPGQPPPVGSRQWAEYMAQETGGRGGEWLAERDELVESEQELWRAFEQTNKPLVDRQALVDEVTRLEEDAAEVEKQWQEHVAASTVTLMSAVNPMQLWIDKTQEAKRAAEEHARAEGQSEAAIASMVAGATASLTDYMNALEQQFAAQDKLVWNSREIIKRLVKEGLSPEEIGVIVEEMGKLPADMVDAYAKSGDVEFERMTGLLSKSAERAADEYRSTFTADLDARAMAYDFVDNWVLIESSQQLKSTAATAGGTYALGFQQGVRDKFGNWTPWMAMDSWAQPYVNGQKAAGDIDQNTLMDMLFPWLRAGGKVSGLAPSTGSVWNAIQTVFPGAVWMGGYATSGHIKNSDHYTGHAFDVGGSPALMSAIAQYLTMHFGQAGLKYIIYNRGINSGGGWRPYHGSNPHTDHVHVSTYDVGGALYPGVTLAENRTGAVEYIVPEALLKDIRSLVDAIRAQVNADKEIAKGLKGATANERILESFGGRSGQAISYIDRESARIAMIEAEGGNAAKAMQDRIKFIEAAIAEAQAQLDIAKDRKMDPETINALAAALFNLRGEGAAARDELADYTDGSEEAAKAAEDLAKHLDADSRALSQLETLYDLASEAGGDLVRTMGLQELMLANVNDQIADNTRVMNESEQGSEEYLDAQDRVLDGLTQLYRLQEKELSDNLDAQQAAIDDAEGKWEQSWQARSDSVQAAYDKERTRAEEGIARRQAAYDREIKLLQDRYDEELAILSSARADVQEAREEADLAAELRKLMSQGYWTEADILRKQELERTMARRAEDKAIDERIDSLTKERDAAVSALQDQADAYGVQSQAHLTHLEAKYKATTDALAREEKAQRTSFDALRTQAQQSYTQAKQDLAASLAERYRLFMGYPAPVGGGLPAGAAGGTFQLTPGATSYTVSKGTESYTVAANDPNLQMKLNAFSAGGYSIKPQGAPAAPTPSAPGAATGGTTTPGAGGVVWQGGSSGCGEGLPDHWSGAPYEGAQFYRNGVLWTYSGGRWHGRSGATAHHADTTNASGAPIDAQGNPILPEGTRIATSSAGRVTTRDGQEWTYDWTAGQWVRKLAFGGIITRPTLALVGERGPEAVIPLSRMSSNADALLRRIEVHLSSDQADVQKYLPTIVRQVRDELAQEYKRDAFSWGRR